MNRRRETKAVALTIAAGLITWGVQNGAGGDLLAGGIAVIIGLLIMVGYQYAEDTDHEKVYNDIVQAIGEDNLRELSEMSADELRKLKRQARGED